MSCANKLYIAIRTSQGSVANAPISVHEISANLDLHLGFKHKLDTHNCHSTNEWQLCEEFWWK